MRAWNPILSHDTYAYYEPAMHSSWADSFLVDRSVTDLPERPNAAEARSVFMSQLKTFSSVHEKMGFPQKYQISDFIAVTTTVLFLVFFWFSTRMVPFPYALATTVLVFVNPWAFSAYYFSTYLAYSMIVLILVLYFLFLLKRPILAGVGIALGLKVNLSVLLLYVFAIGFEVLRQGSQGLKNVWKVVLGIGVTLLVFEIPILLVNLIQKKDYLSQVDLIRRYLMRSLSERIVSHQPPGTSFFLHHLQLDSFALVLLFVTGMVLMLVHVVTSRRAVLKSPAFMISLVALCALIAFDARSGPRFSRSYLVFFPFLALGIVEVFRIKLTELSKPLRRVAASVLVFGIAWAQYESVAKVAELNRVMTSLRTFIDGEHIKQTPAAIFRGDLYRPVFYQAAGEYAFAEKSEKLREVDTVCDLFKVPASRPLVMVSPNQNSIIGFPSYQIYHVQLPLGAHWEMSSPQEGKCKDFRWKAEIVSQIPFFSHYPYFVLEDPSQTSAMLVSKLYSENEYMSGQGSITVWAVEKLK